MLSGEATPVHAVLMRGSETGITEALDDFAQPAEALLLMLVLTPGLLGVGHDTHDLCTQLLHARYAALNFTEGDVKIAVNGFGPAADQGAKFGNPYAGVLQLAAGGIKFRFTQVMDVFAVNAARGQVVPAEFPRRLDLGGEIGSCFVGKSGEFHTLRNNTRRLWSKFPFFQLRIPA